MDGDLGRVNHLPVPLQGRHLVDESQPLGESGVRPLGDVQVTDHLAGCAAGAIASHVLAGGAETHDGVGLIYRGHHDGACIDECV